MTALLLNLVQKIIRIIGPATVHYDEAALTCLNDNRQKLGCRVVVGQHGETAGPEQGSGICLGSGDFPKCGNLSLGLNDRLAGSRCLG